MALPSFLLIPETRGLDLDSPEAILVHKKIIQKKAFLRKIYEEIYSFFRQQTEILKALPGEMLELGSGGGFLKNVLPEVVTSDVAAYPTVDRVVFADHLPFADRSLKAIFMVNVLHHLSEPDLFFKEANRCLVGGGRVIMIEPFNSVLARFVYKHFHHELFDEAISEWRVTGQGRLTASNQALPWIIFWRDRALFESRYPGLRILETAPHTALRYILSGGLSLRFSVPGIFYPLVRWIDRGLAHFPAKFPLFQTIVLERRIP
jgi:SAM-dependent methyltransferase